MRFAQTADLRAQYPQRLEYVNAELRKNGYDQPYDQLPYHEGRHALDRWLRKGTGKQEVNMQRILQLSYFVFVCVVRLCLHFIAVLAMLGTHRLGFLPINLAMAFVFDSIRRFCSSKSKGPFSNVVCF